MPYKQRHVPHAGVFDMTKRLANVAKHQHILTFYYELRAQDAYVTTGASPKARHDITMRILRTFPERATLDVNVFRHFVKRDQRTPLCTNPNVSSYAYDARTLKAIASQAPGVPCTYKASSEERAEAHAVFASLMSDYPTYVITEEHGGVIVLTDVTLAYVQNQYPNARGAFSYSAHFGYVWKRDVLFPHASISTEKQVARDR